MAKCGACDSRILLGGVTWGPWTCCDEQCASNLKTGLVKEILPATDINAAVEQIHQGECPMCKGTGPTDVYTTRKVTGMILAVQWSNERHVCCAPCGRKKRWLAALHCLLLGWWSPKAFLTNIFYIPYNVIIAAFTKPTAHPSKSLHAMTMEILANNNLPLIVSHLQNQK